MRFSPVQIALHDDQRDLGTAGTAILVRTLARLFPSGGTILDVGGGSGWAVPLLRAAGVVPILLDISPDMLAAAARRTVPRIQADLTRLPFRTAALAGIHASYALQNVADWRAAIHESARVLLPGGIAVVAWGSVPTDELLRDVSAHYLNLVRPWSGVEAERRGLDSTDVADATFAACGFDVLRPVSVTGNQIRTPRQIVERVAANPFRARPPAKARAAALTDTLGWTRARYGDLDLSREVTIQHVMHVYRRLDPPGTG